MNNSFSVIDSLTNAYQNKKLGHSLLFWGSSTDHFRDSFIKDLAYRLTQPLRDMSQQKYAQLVDQNIYPDFHSIFPSDKGNIKIDDIHRLDDMLSYTPHESKNRIIYIKQADKMTVQAQNALLKKLEEPPERNFFFLSVHKRNSLLSTIRSRTIPVYHAQPLNFDNIITSICNYFPFISVLKEKTSETFVKKELTFISNLTDKLLENKSLSNYTELINQLLNTTLHIDRTIDIKADQASYVRNLILRSRLGFIAYLKKDESPEMSKEIVAFLENSQYFNQDAATVYNVEQIFKKMK